MSSYALTKYRASTAKTTSSRQNTKQNPEPSKRESQSPVQIDVTLIFEGIFETHDKIRAGGPPCELEEPRRSPQAAGRRLRKDRLRDEKE